MTTQTPHPKLPKFPFFIFFASATCPGHIPGWLNLQNEPKLLRFQSNIAGCKKKRTQFKSGWHLQAQLVGVFTKRTQNVIPNECEGPMEQYSSNKFTKRTQISPFSIKKQGLQKKRTQFFLCGPLCCNPSIFCFLLVFERCIL
jgi:hypothetical protein